MSEIRIKPIGFVRSGIKEVPGLVGRASAPPTSPENLDRWHKRVQSVKHDRSSVSELVIENDLDGILDGIEDFSHLLVLYWAHRIPEERRAETMIHPMGRSDLPLVGIFATRSPVRPNPVLATTVRLLERNGNVLKVVGLEAVDGSPIIDIKPHIRDTYDPDELKMPDWMREVHKAFEGEDITEEGGGR